ncbi:MAG: beta-ketoacyl-ACP synthase III [Actinobacteria bacterium]|nr:beta-ketoacyl-ACP synthase III [Actinomycetota bacterium]
MTDRPGATIAGTGSFVPEKVLANSDLAKIVDTSDEWITVRTGIKQRRIASEGQTTATMAVKACRQALEDAAVAAEDVQAIICATITPEMPLPATACFIQDQLGAAGAAAFDIAAACSGFVYGLEVGKLFIESGRYDNVLVVGSETLSRITDYQDRASCILFGDGAGAVLLRATNDAQRRILYTHLESDGQKWDMLQLPGGGSRYPMSQRVLDERMQYMKIQGRAIYKFAVNAMQELIADAMKACNLSVDDIKLIVPHQVNQRIIDSAMEKLGFPKERVYVNIDRYGNTSSASVPIALDEARRTGKIGAGDTLVMVAFGGGLTWASAVARL